jgi:hypothetical protein
MTLLSPGIKLSLSLPNCGSGMARELGFGFLLGMIVQLPLLSPMLSKSWIVGTSLLRRILFKLQLLSLVVS